MASHGFHISESPKNYTWVCVVCKDKTKYDLKAQKGKEWTCNDCAYRNDVLAWEKKICPFMNRSSSRRDMVRCQTVDCPAFDRIGTQAICKRIDHECC